MLLKKIIAVVKECSKILLTAHNVENKITEKEGTANFVTDYDKQVQRMLQRKLSILLPQAAFLGEEDEVHSFPKEGYLFIVDPIDGTTNFIKDYKASSISVGLALDGEMYLGVVYNPYLDEMFWAEKGKGAYRNGHPIRVSDQRIADGIVLFGTAPYYPQLVDKSFAMARYFFDHSLDIRRSGSAAIDLCSIAAGRGELFFEAKLSPWDFAAGSLIVEEAGGCCVTFDNEKLQLGRSSSVLAVGAGEKEELQELCSRIARL